MSSIKLSPASTGSAIFTIEAPATSTNRTLTLPDQTGTVLTNASQSIPKSALPTGSVLQVVNATTVSSTSTTGATFIATTLAASITPTSSSSKILIFGQAFVTASQSQSQPQITLYRGATDIVGLNYGFGDIYANSAGYMEGVLPFSLLDSPGTTSSTTYTIYLRNNNVGTASLGTSDRRSVITLLEIAA